MSILFDRNHRFLAGIPRREGGGKTAGHDAHPLHRAARWTARKVQKGERGAWRRGAALGGRRGAGRLPAAGIHRSAHQRIGAYRRVVSGGEEPGLSDADTQMSKRKNVLFEGSSVISGTGLAVVVQTGEDTRLAA